MERQRGIRVCLALQQDLVIFPIIETPCLHDKGKSNAKEQLRSMASIFVCTVFARDAGPTCNKGEWEPRATSVPPAPSLSLSARQVSVIHCWPHIPLHSMVFRGFGSPSPSVTLQGQKSERRNIFHLLAGDKHGNSLRTAWVSQKEGSRWSGQEARCKLHTCASQPAYRPAC